MTPMPKYENPLRGCKACSRERHGYNTLLLAYVITTFIRNSRVLEKCPLMIPAISGSINNPCI